MNGLGNGTAATAKIAGQRARAQAVLERLARPTVVIFDPHIRPETAEQIRDHIVFWFEQAKAIEDRYSDPSTMSASDYAAIKGMMSEIDKLEVRLYEVGRARALGVHNVHVLPETTLPNPSRGILSGRVPAPWARANPHLENVVHK